MMKKLLLLMLLCLTLCGCSSTDPAGTAAPTQAAPPETSAPVQGNAQKPTAVTVSNIDDFLDALASNRTVYLESGVYDLSKAAGYGRTGNYVYHWESAIEGYELVLSDAENLTIQAADGADVTIITPCVYSNVLRVRYCENVTLSGLTVGHAEGIGYCSGGVVLLENSQGITIDNCRLYGCGIRGLEAVDCENIHTVNTDIYGCSDGAMELRRCYNVLFENGKIYDCEYYTLIYIDGCHEIALMNSEIFRNSNSDYGILFSSNCPGVYLGGLDVHDNDSFQFFSQVNCPVTVENCRFRSNARLWSDGVDPVDADGNTLTLVDLIDMDMRTAEWTPAPKPEKVPVPPVGEDGMIHVTNVDELLAALAPNTKLYLEPGVYDLTQAQGYGYGRSQYYHWEQVYDGAELYIGNLHGLTLCGAGVDQVQIVTQPRYANVLGFYDCNVLELNGISIGHTEATGECNGGVVLLNSCADVQISNCSLYGCGTIGISAISVDNLQVLAAEIHHCTYGAAWLNWCSQVHFTGCSIHDNGPALFDINECTDVYLDGEPLESQYNYE